MKDRGYKLDEKEQRKVWAKTFRNKHKYKAKVNRLLGKYKTGYNRNGITPNTIVEHIGVEKFTQLYPEDDIKCYLTGKPLTIEELSFDHKIPLTRGGHCTLDNLAITTRLMNIVKSSMTTDEFIQMCRDVVAYQDSQQLLVSSTNS